MKGLNDVNDGTLGCDDVYIKLYARSYFFNKIWTFSSQSGLIPDQFSRKKGRIWT